MPLSKYNTAFGGKKGSASKAYRAMQKQYGAKKGERVFYATKNKNLNRRQDDMVRRFMKRKKHRGRRRGEEARQ
jgi:hypothetical protein